MFSSESCEAFLQNIYKVYGNYYLQYIFTSMKNVSIVLTDTCLFTVMLFYTVFKQIYRGSRLELICRKGVLRNFAKFTGKHLRLSDFFNNVAVRNPQKNSVFFAQCQLRCNPKVCIASQYLFILIRYNRQGIRRMATRSDKIRF